MTDPYAPERRAVLHRVMRLRRLLEREHGHDASEQLIHAFEVELMGVRREGTLEGARRGYLLAQAVREEAGSGTRPAATPPPIPEAARRSRSYTPLSHPPPPPLGSQDVTPVNAVDWTAGPRGRR